MHYSSFVRFTDGMARLARGDSCRNREAPAASIVRERDINDAHLGGNPLFCGDVRLATEILNKQTV
ncbi:hypothetical protein GQ600_23659 [Phytophthora cactorum]|nr:hypothetical protein GQ600_23659 [Phytophthora cactorum]